MSTNLPIFKKAIQHASRPEKAGKVLLKNPS